jgi:hypothetical protein
MGGLGTCTQLEKFIPLRYLRVYQAYHNGMIPLTASFFGVAKNEIVKYAQSELRKELLQLHELKIGVSLFNRRSYDIEDFIQSRMAEYAITGLKKGLSPVTKTGKIASYGLQRKLYPYLSDRRGYHDKITWNSLYKLSTRMGVYPSEKVEKELIKRSSDKYVGRLTFGKDRMLGQATRIIRDAKEIPPFI